MVIAVPLILLQAVWDDFPNPDQCLDCQSSIAALMAVQQYLLMTHA